MFNWTLGPPDLPYDLAEAFQNLTLLISEVTFPAVGAFRVIDAFHAHAFGRTEDSFVLSSVPAVVTLERNISGSLLIREADSSRLRKE